MQAGKAPVDLLSTAKCKQRMSWRWKKT